MFLLPLRDLGPKTPKLLAWESNPYYPV